MKIRTKSLFSMAIFAAIFIIFCGLLISASGQLRHDREQYDLAQTILTNAYDLSVLSNDYIIHDGDRQLAQWDATYEDLTGEISGLSPVSPEEQQLVTNIQQNMVSLNEVFRQVVSTRNAAGSSNVISPEFISLSWSRISVQEQGIISDALQIAEINHERYHGIQDTFMVLVFILVGFLLVFGFIVFFGVTRRVIRSVSDLREGTNRIGAGDLDYRIEEIGQDELGELAGNFNRMVENLQRVTATKADLEQEIVARTAAEEALRKKATDLEASYEEIAASEEEIRAVNEELIRQQQALAASEARYRTLAESAKEFIFVCDPAGTVSYINTFGAAAFGLTPADFTGKKLVELFPPEVAREQGRLLSRVAETKQSIFTEFRIPVRNRVVLMDLQLVPLGAEGGAIRSIMGVARDITERKQAEESVRQTTEYLQKLLNYASIPIIVWNPDFRITRFNHAFEHLTGYTEQEVLERHLELLFPEEKRQASLEQIKKTMSGERLEAVEVPILTVSGETRTVLWNSAGIIGPEGTIAATIAQGVDITERRKAEEELKKYSENLEAIVTERTRELREAQDELVRKEKLAVLGKLAGGVGHELRNPLGAIKNAAYFLDMALEAPEPDVKEMVDLISKEVVRSEDIISSLLDFSRQKPLALRKTDVNAVIRDTLVRYPVPENVTIDYTPDAAVPEVQADPDKLLQVFGNLITNAYQAIPEKGTLTITTDHSAPGWVSVSFRDSGTGIPEENMKRLFEPLFTTKTKGIGLGLVVTKTIVEMHGGRIEVRSEEGKGATFTVRLPLSGKKEE
jgi:PAS domain S-box-containing protein